MTGTVMTTTQINNLIGWKTKNKCVAGAAHTLEQVRVALCITTWNYYIICSLDDNLTTQQQKYNPLYLIQGRARAVRL